MIPDLEPFFKEYQMLAATAEQTFEKIKTDYPDCVKCKTTCTDCCYAVFDLPLIEAIFINTQFNRRYEGKAKYALLEKSNRIDRKLHKIKRNAYKDFEGGKSESDILLEMSKIKVRCPLLNDNDLCELYDSRPITCRLYGIPTAIGGKGRTCGLSGFKSGASYPTVHLEKIHQKLYEISDKMVRALHSKHVRMGEILMPISMAILTDFNEEYLGIPDDSDSSKETGHE